ncbi:SDR family oxidoreductase [Magnetococcus sp. PR-3]|uniref:SDR family oxidoreductase n=1 Tax=Magnetococcus sp. PR-3 TaxID=3120355 RepID=UPI002FCDEB33
MNDAEVIESITLTNTEQQSAKRVLIIGASGFIGRHIVGAIIRAGHHVWAASRSAQQLSTATPMAIDLTQHGLSDLIKMLNGIDVVINCAGLIQSQGQNTLAKVHDEGAARLIQACSSANVTRLIHLSAIGVSEQGTTAYQRTKAAAEQSLRRVNKQHLDWCILRPSLVIGRGGTSSQMLTALAALPFPPRMGKGLYQTQPLHIDDLSALVVHLIEQLPPLPDSIELVGPEPLSTDQLINTLRTWLGLPPRPFMPIPDWVLNVSAVLSERMINAPLNRDVLTMLRQEIKGDATAFTQALGRPPTALAQALAKQPASSSDKQGAHLYLLRTPLRWSLGLLWLIAGLLSFGLYPVEKSLEMLSHLHITGGSALALLYSAAFWDMLLGVLLLVRFRPVLVGGIQLLTLFTFSVLAIGLPAEYWLHPFTPLVKNLPIAAATLVMMALEKGR